MEVTVTQVTMTNWKISSSRSIIGFSGENEVHKLEILTTPETDVEYTLEIKSQFQPSNIVELEVEEGKLSVLLTSEMLGEDGLKKMQVVGTLDEQKKKSNWFEMIVEKSINAESNIAEHYPSILEEILEQLRGKQDKLTAGNGIGMPNNVISVLLATGDNLLHFSDGKLTLSIQDICTNPTIAYQLGISEDLREALLEDGVDYNIQARLTAGDNIEITNDTIDVVRNTDTGSHHFSTNNDTDVIDVDDYNYIVPTSIETFGTATSILSYSLNNSDWLGLNSGDIINVSSEDYIYIRYQRFGGSDGSADVSYKLFKPENLVELSDISVISNKTLTEAYSYTNQRSLQLASNLTATINSSTYVMTLSLLNDNNTTISTATVDLPLESVVVNGTYDSSTQEVVLTLQGGGTIRFSVAALVSGLVDTQTYNAGLATKVDIIEETGQQYLNISENYQISLSNYAKIDFSETELPTGAAPTFVLNCAGDVYDLTTNPIVDVSQYSMGTVTWAYMGGHNIKWTLTNDVVRERDMVNYVKGTDYATSSKGGVIKSGQNGFQVTESGTPWLESKTYSQYTGWGNPLFISKGTLENVISGKRLLSDKYELIATITASSENPIGIASFTNLDQYKIDHWIIEAIGMKGKTGKGFIFTNSLPSDYGSFSFSYSSFFNESTAKTLYIVIDRKTPNMFCITTGGVVNTSQIQRINNNTNEITYDQVFKSLYFSIQDQSTESDARITEGTINLYGIKGV